MKKIFLSFVIMLVFSHVVCAMTYTLVRKDNYASSTNTFNNASSLSEIKNNTSWVPSGLKDNCKSNGYDTLTCDITGVDNGARFFHIDRCTDRLNGRGTCSNVTNGGAKASCKSGYEWSSSEGYCVEKYQVTLKDESGSRTIGAEVIGYYGSIESSMQYYEMTYGVTCSKGTKSGVVIPVTCTFPSTYFESVANCEKYRKDNKKFMKMCNNKCADAQGGEAVCKRAYGPLIYYYSDIEKGKTVKTVDGKKCKYGLTYDANTNSCRRPQ